MAAYYRTSEQDTLDLICWKYYGIQSGAVEYVLDQPENRHLADKGPVYPAGEQIWLPDLPEALRRRVSGQQSIRVFE